jgi:putative ABC transport system permease protein
MKEVEAVCRLSWQSEKPSFKDGERDLEFDDAMFLADSTFFNVFSFKLLQGDSRNTLNRPATMAISQKMANQYFPNESPIGKTIQYNNLDLEITGVFENVPTSSHLKFSCLVSLLTLEQLGSYLHFDCAWCKHPGAPKAYN